MANPVFKTPSGTLTYDIGKGAVTIKDISGKTIGVASGRGISTGEFQKRVREQLAKQQQEAQKEAQEKSRQAELKRQAELERQRLIEKQRADAQARKEQLVKEREFVKEFKQMNQAERSQAIKEQVEYARATRYQKQLEGGARLTPQRQRVECF